MALSRKRLRTPPSTRAGMLEKSPMSVPRKHVVAPAKLPRSVRKATRADKPGPAALSTPVRTPISARNPALKAHMIFLVLILILGAFLRFWGLTHHSIWWDEAGTIKLAKKSHTEILEYLKIGDSPPLFSFLLHTWIKAFGSGETAVRVFPAIFGFLLLPVLYWIGSALFSRRAGLLAALVAAAGEFHVRYSQEVRMYTLLPLLGVLSLYMLYKAVLENTTRHWVAYAMLMTATLYTHNYGTFIAASGVVFFVAIALKQKVRWKKFLIVQGLVGLAYLPWFLIVVGSQIGSPGIVGWIPRMRLSLVLRTFQSYSGLIATVFRPALNGLIVIAGGLVFFACFLAGVFSLKKGGKKGGVWRLPVPYVSSQAGLVLVLCYLTVTLALPMLISIWKPIFLPYRYSIAAWPAFVLIVGLGLAKIKRPAVLAAALAIILAVSSVSLYWYHRVWVKAYDRDIAAFIDSKAGPNDVIVSAPNTLETPIKYYLRAPLKSVGFNGRGDTGSETLTRIMAQLTDPGAKVFFVNIPLMTWIPHMQELGPLLDSHFSRGEQRKYEAVVLTIYLPKPAIK